MASYKRISGLVCVAVLVVSAEALLPITPGAVNKSVLGDVEVSKICNLTCTSLCPAAGAADTTCQEVAKAAGNTSNVICGDVNVCNFTVLYPQQHPEQSGTAYVTKGQVEGYAVIFPCSSNGLVIGVPNSEIGAPASNTSGQTGNNPAPAGSDTTTTCAPTTPK